MAKNYMLEFRCRVCDLPFFDEKVNLRKYGMFVSEHSHKELMFRCSGSETWTKKYKKVSEKRVGEIGVSLLNSGYQILPSLYYLRSRGRAIESLRTTQREERS